MNKRAVVITAQGFEDEEVIYPIIRLKEAGFDVDVATKDKALVVGRKLYPLQTLVRFYAAHVEVATLNPADYDVVIVPGGFEAPDKLRQIPEVLAFLKNMEQQGKIVAAICHGPWVLVSAGLLKGKKATGYPSIRDDIQNAGAEYVDQAVVEDGVVITSRHPGDVGEFMKAVLARI